MKKRLISLLLAFSMVLTFLPVGAVSAFADDGIDESKGEWIRDTGTVLSIDEPGTYQLRGDYTAPIEVKAAGEVIINITGDINYTGKHSKYGWYNYFIRAINPDGTLIVNNRDNFVFDAVHEGEYDSFMRVYNNGHATVNGGIYKGCCFFNEGSTMTLNDLTVDAVEETHAVNSHGGTTTVVGGTYYGGATEDGYWIPTIHNQKGCNLTLDGVTVVAKDIAIWNGGTVTIKGGNYTGDHNVICNKPNCTVTIEDGEFTETSGNRAIVNDGSLYFKKGTVTAPGSVAIENRDTAEIGNVTVEKSKYGIYAKSGSTTLGNAKFTDNGTDIYLAADQKITIEDTFADTATVKVADDPITAPRQITTEDSGDYQKSLKLTSQNDAPNGKKYLIRWKQEDGQEYRYLTEQTGYTVTAENATATLDGETLYSYDEVEEGKDVTLTADAPEDGWKFAGWQVTEGDLLLDDSAETVTFKMPASDVVVSAQYEYVGNSADGSDDIQGALSAVVVGAAAGAIIYETGTGIYRVINMPGIPMPSNRIELAELIWEHAGKPEPESTEFYGDISEDDTDWQKAARWAVEQDLMQDDEDNNKFHPYFPVSKLRTCLTWNAAKEKGLFDTDKTTE